MTICNVTVAIPTYQRPDALLKALEQIHRCTPKPDEIIVHIDGGDVVTEPVLHQSEFKNIVIITNTVKVGPGGGRNVAIARAKNEIVVSFDDDSYPVDSDYFARLIHLFETFPEAAVIGAAIYHQNESIQPDEPHAAWVADFVGCGCAYRKSAFLQTTGYVQLPVAYDMEEIDLSLRLYNMGWRILHSPWLRVFHDTALEHHQNPKITAASITNRALLVYLRYPSRFWWLGVAQCLNRTIWLINHKRFAGILEGLLNIPTTLYRHRYQRQVVTAQSLQSYFSLRRKGINEPFNLDLLSNRCP